jgi:FHS family L-fucose permease-like MFS transporter
LGSETGASSRLNLSQAFNSLGTTIAPIIGAAFLLSDTIKSSEEITVLSEAERHSYYLGEASAVQQPFLILAGCIGALAILFVFIKLPKILEKSPKGGYGELLKNKWVLMGVFGIFVYVGAEVAIGSYLVNYFMDMDLAPLILENETMATLAQRFSGKDITSIDPKAVVGAFVFLYWGGAMIGRFVGSYLTRILKPAFVLSVFASLAGMMLLISMNTSGLVAMGSILVVGLFNSIMFPTIFSLTIEGLGDLKPQASGLLCMAIVGGAILPPLYGLLTDHIGFKLALFLLIACYGYIFYFGYQKQHIKKASTT